MRRAKPRPDIPPLAKRMIILREALGYDTQLGFATYLGYSMQRYNNWERGTNVPHNVALEIVRRVPGLTTDWLYRGSLDGVSYSLVQKIQAAERRLYLMSPGGVFAAE